MSTTGAPVSCRHCAGALEYLGALGRLVYGRCRQCGLLQPTGECPDCYGLGEILVETATEPLQELCATCEGSGLAPTPEP